MSKCACIYTDAYDCWEARYNRKVDDHLYEIKTSFDTKMDGGPCSCACHNDIYDEPLDE